MVTGVVVENVPPPPLSVKVTVAPEIGLPYWSFNETTRFLVNFVFGLADWLLPETMAKLVAGPATDFSVMLTLMFPSLAVTVKDFATVGSVKVVLACPFEPVIAGFGEKVPPIPPSANDTGAPATAIVPFLAFTTICSGRVVPTVPDCFPPETIVMTVTFGVEVSVNDAVVYPELLAVMVAVSTFGGRV